MRHTAPDADATRHETRPKAQGARSARSPLTHARAAHLAIKERASACFSLSAAASSAYTVAYGLALADMPACVGPYGLRSSCEVARCNACV